MSDAPLILGIETSCDETGVGIVRGDRLLADAVATSVEEHARFGGVVPEVASRAHLEAMVPHDRTGLCHCGASGSRTSTRSRSRAGPAWPAPCWWGWPPPRPWRSASASRCTASTTWPPTSPSTSWSTGHCPSRACALLVSGGHSSLLRVEDVTGVIEPLGATIDDAAGEAFDKVARLLGLPFPGGPHIDRVARDGDSVAIDFPRGLTGRRDLERHRFDFSFSGLKSAVARWVEARERSGEPVPVNDVAASFQEAVCDVLVRKALDAAVASGIDDLLIGGGVAANSRLRVMAEERAAKVGVRVRVPRPGLCTDNGAMVAALGAEMVARGRTPSRLDLPADSSLPVTTVLT